MKIKIREKKLVGKKMIEPIKIEKMIKELEGKYWQPKDIAKVNNQVIRLAIFKGEYHWHKHTNEDELFFIYRGTIQVKFKEQANVIGNDGEIIIIPKGIEHCPIAEGEAIVLIFEPESVRSRGD